MELSENINWPENSSADYVRQNCQVFKNLTSTIWIITRPYLAQTVHVCSSHLEPWQNINTRMQTTCMSVKTADVVSSSRTNWNPIIKYTSKWPASCVLSQNVVNASREYRS